MNKLFTKIASACLGLAMAVGVGVVVGTSKANIMPADATSGDEYSFSTAAATSGTSTDGIWEFSCAQNSGTNAPAYNSNSSELRLYYSKSNPGNGCSITIKVKNSSQNLITGITFTASGKSYTTLIKWYESEGTNGTGAEGSWSGTVTTYTPAQGVAAITLQNAGSESTQLRLKKVAVTYSTTTTTANLKSITATTTQTEVYQGESLDEDLITVIGHYSDDKDREIVTGWNVSCDTSVVREDAIATVTYTDDKSNVFRDTFNVDVVTKPTELDVTIDNFTEITTKYDNYTHTYSGLNDLNGGTTSSVSLYAHQAYKNGSGIQMTNGKNCHINNTTPFPGRILSITATFTASGKNTTKMYAANNMEATTSSSEIGSGSSSNEVQEFDFSDGNYNYFYFDLSNVAGAVYYSLHIEYGALKPEITSSTYEETIYTSNSGGAATSFTANLTYSNFTSIEDVDITSSDTEVIPLTNCVFSNDYRTLTVSGNAVAGETTLTVTAMDSDSEVYSCEIDVIVLNNSSSLTSIAVTSQPEKTDYIEGEALDLTGVEVTATYSDLSTQDVTSNCEFSPANGAVLSPSDTTVTVSYTFSGVTKNASISLTISPMPKYTLVNDITQLVEGAKVLITGEKDGATYVAKKYVSGNNVGAVKAALENGNVIKTPEMSAMTIGTNSNGYTLMDEGNLYLYAASSSNNHMKGQDKPSINAYWSITYSSGSFSLIAEQSENRNVMQYNASSNLFSCYSSDSQSPIKLYVLDAAPTGADKLTTFGRLFLKSTEIPLKTEQTGEEGTDCVVNGTYLKAKAALAGDWSTVKNDLQNDITGLALRYEAWARAAGDAAPYDDNDSIITPLSKVGIFGESNSSITIIVVISLASFTAIGGYFFLRKRKEH